MVIICRMKFGLARRVIVKLDDSLSHIWRKRGACAKVVGGKSISLAWLKREEEVAIRMEKGQP